MKATYLVAGVIIGVIGGVTIGIVMHPTPDPALGGSAHIPALPSAALPAPPSAPGPPAADLDFGPAAATTPLRGQWGSSVELGFRHAAVTTASRASVVLAAAPSGSVESLYAVVRAVGLATDQTITVTVSTADGKLATWPLSRRWQLLVAPWPADGPLTEQAVVDFSVEIPADAKVLKGQQAGFALDQLWLTRPADRASLRLRSSNDQARLLSGFWRVEQATLGMLPAVWSRDGQSQIALVLRPGTGGYVLRVRAEAYAPIAPVAVTASINGKVLGSRRVDRLDDHVYPVPASTLVDGVNMVRLEYGTTARPVDHGEDDDREIAIRLLELDLEPAPD